MIIHGWRLRHDGAVYTTQKMREVGALVNGENPVHGYLLQPVPALDEVDQPLCEARRRSTVHHVMVEGDWQVEKVPRFHALIDDSWFACDAPDDQQKGLSGR